MSWYTLLENPVLSLPLIVLTGATVGWAAWNVRDLPVRISRPTPRRLPDRDPVSRAYHAFLSGRFSDALDRAEERLDRASTRRFGRPSGRLPRTMWGAEKLAPGHAPAVLQLRRLSNRLAALRAVAQRREAGVWVRLDFWRSREELRRRFLLQLHPLLEEVAKIPPRWAGVA